jgi:hypothetical protein
LDFFRKDLGWWLALMAVVVWIGPGVVMVLYGFLKAIYLIFSAIKTNRNWKGGK